MDMRVSAKVRRALSYISTTSIFVCRKGAILYENIPYVCTFPRVFVFFCVDLKGVGFLRWHKKSRDICIEILSYGTNALLFLHEQ